MSNEWVDRGRDASGCQRVGAQAWYASRGAHGGEEHWQCARRGAGSRLRDTASNEGGAERGGGGQRDEGVGRREQLHCPHERQGEKTGLC